MSEKRCETCDRRLDRPADPYCGEAESHPEPTHAQRIVEAIMDDLTDRRGLRQEWEHIDVETQDEIRDEWTSIVESHLKQS